MSRELLPYRETSDCFLIYRNGLVTQSKGHYLAFPGGGVDSGETPMTSARREIMEEVGVVLDGDLQYITTIDWDWFPEWADTEKRKERYKQFRGERIHLFVGTVKEFVQPTSTEGDGWTGELVMPFADVISLAQRFVDSAKPAERIYKLAQLTIIKTLASQVASEALPKLSRSRTRRTSKKSSKRGSKKRPSRRGSSKRY